MTRFGDWEALEKISEGGQGEVWKVRRLQDDDGQLYALKRLKNPKRLERFEVEARLGATLSEVGLPVSPIIDLQLKVGEGKREKPFFVMPFYSQGTLRRRLRTGVYTGNLHLCISLLKELKEALDQLHEHVAHRDIKPENLFFNDQGSLVLGDLGLLRALDTNDPKRLTETAEQVGSRHYMAPEALRGLDQVNNPRALDVFSFGKIAFEALAGHQLLGIGQPQPAERLSLRDEKFASYDSLVFGLLDPDPEQRMLAWTRTGRLFETIEDHPVLVDPQMVAAQVASAARAHSVAGPEVVQAEHEQARSRAKRAFRKASADCEDTVDAITAHNLRVVVDDIGHLRDLNRYRQHLAGLEVDPDRGVMSSGYRAPAIVITLSERNGLKLALLSYLVSVSPSVVSLVGVVLALSQNEIHRVLHSEKLGDWRVNDAESHGLDETTLSWLQRQLLRLPDYIHAT